MPASLASRIIAFNKALQFRGQLPAGIRIMNPFRESTDALKASAAFYKKYYNDRAKRFLILGINPGRFGGGITGIPFTDPKRLVQACGIPFAGPVAHEPSSAFVYEMITAFGGPEAFYRHFYINSLCPLGFTAKRPNGKEVNYNYYDSPALEAAVFDFIVWNVQQQIALGMHTHTCFCLGTGKNETFLRKLNNRFGFFENIVALEHPRYIMQYKSKEKEKHVAKYVEVFSGVLLPSAIPHTVPPGRPKNKAG
jgi:hypothetical protein